MKTGQGTDHPPPPTWGIILGFTLIYVSWGTTYYAMRVGVGHEGMPPGLFGGVRVSLAGWVLLLYLWARGERIRLSLRELGWVTLTGSIMFVAGNGLITVAMGRVPSGLAAVLVATTPLWLGVMETFWPGGDRLRLRGWVGLSIGLGGVVLLMVPRLQHPEGSLDVRGLLLIFGSAMAWALGSLLVRHGPRSKSHLTTAAYQMIVGGSCLAIIGMSFGEWEQLAEKGVTLNAVYAFVYLLVVGSLVGFVAFNWLLGHVPASLVGTYAYVNPVIAVIVGWQLDAEHPNQWVIGGMMVILAGVALVRGGSEPREQGALTVPSSSETSD